jgi:hypothetical protein
MSVNQIQRTAAQRAREAIQRLYIAMRHLFIRGGYKPLGDSGRAIIDALRTLEPEIYGLLNDPEKVELDGLLYIFQRLPKGIEECQYIRLISREGFENASFQAIVPPKRRRSCYRIDKNQFFIEMTRGHSDIYDILTHLTFMYCEAEKIRNNSLDSKGNRKREWLMLEEIVEKEAHGEEFSKEVAFTYLSTILGRTYKETMEAYEKFQSAMPMVNSLFHIVYWLGKRSIQEFTNNEDREITFSSALRERVGHHIYGELWADHIKGFLAEKKWLDRPIHIISANLHSVMNCFYALTALKEQYAETPFLELVEALSKPSAKSLRKQVEEYALAHGMYYFEDKSGTNIGVQVFDTTYLQFDELPIEITYNVEEIKKAYPILIVMDYAFGEQAFEAMDELLKPYQLKGENQLLEVCSISIMGKAGILEGDKGDIMVATAHVFEGTADNYPVENDFTKADFEGHNLKVFEGPMVTVLGTSLQNKEILRYFLDSSWGAVGLEMEGAHYQKAIQAASKIRNSIRKDVVTRYAYYASDNPLVTGATLASGGLGLEGVLPTYLVTSKILSKILNPVL